MIAVIGAKSFTGEAFCLYAEARGTEVTRYTRPEFDLNINPQGLAMKIAKSDAKTVVNFAALNMVGESWPHYQDYYRANVIGVANVAQMLAALDWKGRWIQVSTPEVYGQKDHRIDEHELFNPSTPYAVSRAACDMHLRALKDSFGFDVIFTRSVNVYGPRQPIYRIIPKTVFSILRGQKLKLHGGGVSRRSYLHVRDVADLLFRLVHAEKAHGDYLATSQTMLSIGDLVRKIFEGMGVDPSGRVIDVADRPGKDGCYLLDDKRLREETLWTDRVIFDIGLQDTVNWYIDNQERFKNVPLEYEHKI